MLWEAARRHEGVGRSHPAAREPLGRAQVASRAKSRIRVNESSPRQHGALCAAAMPWVSLLNFRTRV